MIKDTIFWSQLSRNNETKQAMIESESELAEVPRIADGDNGKYYGSTANSKAKMHCLRLSFTQRKSTFISSWNK